MSARILVVDDPASMRQMVAFALTSGGFDVTEAGTRKGLAIYVVYGYRHSVLRTGKQVVTEELD